MIRRKEIPKSIVRRKKILQSIVPRSQGLAILCVMKIDTVNQLDDKRRRKNKWFILNV